MSTMDREEMRKALSRAFNYGQTYFAQSDSESYSQNKRADKTWADYERFVEETIAAMAHSCAQDADLRKLLADAADWVDSVHDGEWPFHPFTRDELVDRLLATLSRHGG